MTFVIGRGEAAIDEKPSGELGTYRALDGSSGAPLYLDLDGPHAMLVVGKRGYGKSYTMGVVAEELARADGVAPVVVDPMGAFRTLATAEADDPVPAELVDSPAITPDSLDPRSWCELLGLSPESGAGGLVWQAAQDESSLDAMREHVGETDAPATDRRAATNHLDLAESWGIFDTDGLDATALNSSEITVLDVSGLDAAPMNAIVRGVGETLYRARVEQTVPRLPWLLIDEAHTFFEGIAHSALQLILTRGRAPGVSLVLATQRPSAVPEVGISQSDILISHRLTSGKDLAALQDAQPTYMDGSLDERLPTDPGEVVIVDDSTETVHAAQIRRRSTAHGGGSPSASDVAVSDRAATAAEQGAATAAEQGAATVAEKGAAAAAEHEGATDEGDFEEMENTNGSRVQESSKGTVDASKNGDGSGKPTPGEREESTNEQSATETETDDDGKSEQHEDEETTPQTDDETTFATDSGGADISWE